MSANTSAPTSNTSEKANFDLSSRNRTKIVATLGPVSSDSETVSKLLDAGASVFRLNFSHGTAQDHQKCVETIRGIAESRRQPIAILADLQGPKFRTGPLKDKKPIHLENSSTVTFTCKERESGLDKKGQPVIGTKYEPLLKAVAEGDTILIADGKMRLKVTKKPDEHTAICTVLEGGLLEARKGINIPGSAIEIEPLTEKDKEDAITAVQLGADYLALSFVQKASDVNELKQHVESRGYTCPPIIAKIEKPQAVECLPAILEASDGLMIARGDLGVELPPERVPVIQKQILELASQHEKPVIVATQMLESMIDSLQPARSDVSDIANAVFDHADAVMLSNETAMGTYPVEAVLMMQKIIVECEKSHLADRHRPHEVSSRLSPSFHHAITHSASYAATKANVKAIVALSESGSMAKRLSKVKPQRPIIAITQHEDVANRMCLLWGVSPLVSPQADTTDETMEWAEFTIFSQNLLNSGDSIVFCAGKNPLRGLTNILKIYNIGDFTKVK